MTAAQKTAAQKFQATMDAIRAGSISVDAAREANRALRAGFTDAEWNQVKLGAFAVDQRRHGV